VRRTIATAALAASLALSCHGDSGPTAPEQPTVQLAGTWHGTVHYKSPVGFYYDESRCPDQAVTVSINQHGSAIDGTIQAPCVTAQFEATIGPRSFAAHGRASETVNGIFYTSELTLNLILQNGERKQIEGSSTPFQSATGGQRDGLVLTVSR
jgi:hypothetical protein